VWAGSQKPFHVNAISRLSADRFRDQAEFLKHYVGANHGRKRARFERWTNFDNIGSDEVETADSVQEP
jgi:hypothetical protein